MARQIFLTDDNKRIVVDRETDVCIYDAYDNNRTRGTDLYAHKARSGKWYFYEYEWSQWQGESSTIKLLSDNEIEAVVIKLRQKCEVSEKTVDSVSKMLDKDLFEEEA